MAIAMDANAVIGCMVIAGALAFVTYMVLWSRRSIERIAQRGFRSVREISSEPSDDK